MMFDECIALSPTEIEVTEDETLLAFAICLRSR
jgi:hypothetical protein